MKEKTLRAPEEILAIIRSSAVDEDGLTLPAEPLDRKTYQDVNKFLETAGAKWNRGKKRHLFQPGAKDRIAALLSSGEIVDEKQTYQAFYTPDDLARRLVAMAEIEPGMFCLEPSAGRGALAIPMRDAGGSVLCIENHAPSVGHLGDLGFVVEMDDFLSVPADPRFDRVVTNPPFTADQDIKHVMHAFGFLKDGGRLLAIMGTGWTFGETKAKRAFRDFLDEVGSIVEELPEGTFRESGTNVRTVIVEMWR